jgi:peptidoglycan/xylan/chitin deacetylase (PgdA/CDA1 family)
MRSAVLVLGLLVSVSAVAALLVRSPATSAAPGQTIVSLTFDDGRTTQYSARAPLAAHGMHGTFFVNSGVVAPTPGGFYMTWAQIHDLGSDGNEITGHSLTHPHLTQLSTADLRHEICDDRTNLLNQGFSPVLSFAYPFAEYNAAVESMVNQCGYLSARTVGGLRSGNQCSGCPFAETLPPLDAYATRTPEDISSSTSLAQMETYVTQAEQNGGGWVQLVFHGIGDRGGVPLNQFTAFLDWLQPRAANGTVTQTVYEAMTGGQPPGQDTFPPSTTIACNGSACSGWYGAAVTVSLSATDFGGSGLAVTRYTTDGTDPTESSNAYSASFQVFAATSVKFRSWDNAGNAEATKAQAIQIDTIGPAVTITAPTAGAVLTSPNVTITAAASDSGSGMRQVAFFVDNTALGTSSTAPYQIRWRARNSGSGQHVLTAVATDVAGNSTTSAPVTVTVR